LLGPVVCKAVARMKLLAICQHRNDVGIRDCFTPVLLMVTKSPMRDYEYLVVERCPEHLNACWGVLDETSVDDDYEQRSNWGAW